MRYFAKDSQLAGLDVNTRLVMTYFLVFMLMATGLSIFMSYQRSHLSPRGASEYYRGSETGMVFPKEPAELIETAHFHLFVMPLVFITTGHLFLLTSWSRRRKTAVVTSCFLYILLDIGKPWLVRYVAPGWGVLAPINSALLAGTMLLCILVPLYEMWFARGPRETP